MGAALAFAWLLLLLPALLLAADPSPASKMEWEKTVEAAKKEGQIAVQQHLASEGNIRESLRVDIPKDVIPPSHRRDPKIRYLMISRAADIDGENDALKLATDALAGAKKK